MGKIKRLLKSVVKKIHYMVYAGIYCLVKVQPNVILYESFWGRGIIDNPYAMFKELLGREEFRNYQHIWILENFRDSQAVTAQYGNYPNVKFVSRRGVSYMIALSKAKYLINNVTFPYYFTKKETQIYVNTWHGTPVKSMGYETQDGNLAAANTVRNFLAADYLLSANDRMTEMYEESYKLKGIYSGQILEEGYPRNDLLVKTEKAQVAERLRQYQIHLEENKKVILYAPTWRGASSGTAVVNPDELLQVKEKLEQIIDTQQYQILIKPHQYVYQALKDKEQYRGVLVPSFVDANELLSIVDILVSDFSSIFIDFMVLRRPVLFYIPDLAEYASTRGFKMELQELPGPYSDSLDEIGEHINHIETVMQTYCEIYEKLYHKLCSYEDGKAAARVVNAVFKESEACPEKEMRDDRLKLLISPYGLPENGITHSFLGLLEQVDYDKWDVTVLLMQDQERLRNNQRLYEINKNARVLVRCGSQVFTFGEWLRFIFASVSGLFTSDCGKRYPKKGLKREFRRCFGMTEFDYIVDFTGYNPTLSVLLLQGKARSKSVWMHNDIHADMNKVVDGKKKNYKRLRLMWALYPQFDRLVSCSHSVMEVNREKLGTPETYAKFAYAKNTINVARIEEGLSEQDPERAGLKQLPDKRYTNFMNMGRMSTEKNQAALIRAFGRFRELYPDTKLYVVGDGVLKKDLEKLVQTLKLEDAVCLTGNISNPFLLMKYCDCFILPSVFEGQPVVLLEARVCGLPIIVSEFSTVRDSLYPNGQLLIQHDEDSIYSGLCSFMKGDVPRYEFSGERYNQEAFEEFVNAICEGGA